jgi:hypothetical protein
MGSGHAYLNRNVLHGVLEASIGFKVDTTVGHGKVVGYVNAGKKFLHGKYFLQIKGSLSKENGIVMLKRNDIIQCPSGKLIEYFVINCHLSAIVILIRAFCFSKIYPRR